MIAAVGGGVWGLTVHQSQRTPHQMPGARVQQLAVRPLIVMAAQGLLAELQKDERNVEGVITADLKKAEDFLERIEAQYRLPKWMPFKDFVFRWVPARAMG